jgi:hypothetical protein
MAYKNWKLMEKLDVAVRGNEKGSRYDFNGYIVEHGDKDALKKAEDWARITPYDYDKKQYKKSIEPTVHTFDNEGFTATILDSAGGSSQGGRLSFWRCKVEKDGVEFTIGVNDAILADLIKNSDISNGKIKQKLMFARKGGQPGLIHEGMEAYADATADMKHKADMKSMKKTSKWELGGVYSSITKTDICLGPVWDTMEEVDDPDSRGWYPRKKVVPRDEPVQVTAWLSFYERRHDGGLPTTFAQFMEDELKDKYLYFTAGKPPSRAKTQQLEVKESDQELVDEFFKKVAKHYAETYKEIPRYVRKVQ